ncbi:MAG TPA: SIS domain-containing protein [Solirubrobacteraceae bacterium]|nr:SIS domain-containing protein [Solirubrobacteraceae bacterium]
MSDEPEVRPGPPWAMEEMIEAEPGLVEPVLATPALDELAALVASAQPVVLTGCGTSEHAAMAGAAMLREVGVPAIARDAFEARLDPQQGGVLIAISHEAGTEATLAAAAAAGARGARCALVTAQPGNAPEGLATIATPLRDTSWCHTVGYLSPMLALYGLASRVAGTAPAPAPVAEAIAGVMERRRALAERASALIGCSRLLVVGSGVDEITGRELALKVEEGVHLPVTPLGLEKALHGHLPAADERTGLVVLRLDPRSGAERDARAANLLAAARVLRMPAVVLGADELPAPAELPPVAGALLTGAPAAQLLTLELVHAAGTNPDLIRREEPAYRAAAEAAGAG